MSVRHEKNKGDPLQTHRDPVHIGKICQGVISVEFDACQLHSNDDGRVQCLIPASIELVVDAVHSWDHSSD